VLPTFIVIGSRKSGTTSLWRYLGAHPGVFVPEHDKEPKFFVAERGWGRGLAWYESLFEAAPLGVPRGELSTDYSIYPLYAGVPARMAEVVPSVRLVYLMRDPLEHMRSAYAYSLWLGTEWRPIDEALLLDARYAYECMYALQVEQYLRYFPRSQLLLLTAEELRYRREDTMRRILEFIGADPGTLPANMGQEFNRSEDLRVPRTLARLAGDLLIRSKVASHVPARANRFIERFNRSAFLARRVTPEELFMDEDLRARLIDLLHRDLEELKDLMGPGFDCWGLL